MPPGVLFAFTAYAVYSCSDAITKSLGSGLPVYEIAFFSTLFSLLPALFTTPKGENWLTFWKLKHPFLTNLRGVSGVIGNLCIIYAFVSIPLAEAYSIAFLAPIFIVFISMYALHEKVSWQRMIFLAASFIGVLIVVRPGFRELHWGHLAALVSAVCGGITTTTMRRVARDEMRTSLIGIATVYILGLNFILIMANGGFHWPNMQQLAALLAIGGLGGSGNIFFITATRNAPASMVAPTQYSQIFWAVLFGALFFAEFPAPIAYLGLLIIIVAGVLNVVSGDTRIRIFSRSSPSGAGPATIEESSGAAIDAVLEAPIAGATEVTSQR